MPAAIGRGGVAEDVGGGGGGGGGAVRAKDLGIRR